MLYLYLSDNLLIHEHRQKWGVLNTT